MSSKIYHPLIFVLLMVLLAACAPSEAPRQTTIVQTQQASVPAEMPAYLTRFDPVLVQAGFIRQPIDEANCETPCTVYKGNWDFVVEVYENGKFMLFCGFTKDHMQEIYPIITQLYGQDVTDWILNQQAYAINDSNGSVGDFDIYLNQEFSDRALWINITPK